MQLPAVSLHLVVANFAKQTEMKNHKLILSVSAAALLLGSAACRPDNPAPDPDPTEKYVWIEPNIERTGTHVALLEKQDDGSYLIELPASDPYIYFFPFEEDLPGENTVLAFEYKAENAIDRTQCFFIDAEEGLNAEYWSTDPLTVNLGTTSIIKGLELSLLGCREGDSVEAYMTFEAAYGSDQVGIVPVESSVLWVYTINKLVKN